METITSMCGLDCAACPAFLATLHDSDVERQTCVEKWSTQFGRPMSVADINCRGCLTESDVVFGYCKVCEIRACARGRGLATCAPCPDYPCSKVAQIHAHVPEAKAALDALRADA